MQTHLHMNNLFLSLFATVLVFVFTSGYSPLARAAVTNAYQSNQAAPVVLAWYGGRGWNRGGYYGYRGYGYRGYGYRGGAYGVRCARTCFRNAWGRVECVRRCY